jgi:hypothetical protein
VNLVLNHHVPCQVGNYVTEVNDSFGFKKNSDPLELQNIYFYVTYPSVR